MECLELKSTTAQWLYNLVTGATDQQCSQEDIIHIEPLLEPSIDQMQHFLSTSYLRLCNLPLPVILTAPKRVLRYLCGIMDKGLLFQSSVDLFQFILLSRIQTGLVIKLIGTRQQDLQFIQAITPFVGLLRSKQLFQNSSTETGYRSLAITAIELCWLRHLLRDFHIFSSKPPLEFCDNKSTTLLTHKYVFHGRTKHTKIDFHFIRERVVSKDIDLHCILIKQQAVDIFTEPLTEVRLCYLRDKLVASRAFV